MAAGVRTLVVTLWPHEKDTTVTVVVRDSCGRDRWDRRTGHFALAVGRDEISGLPVERVLAVLGAALSDRAATRLDPAHPEPLEGLQGGLRCSPDYEALTLDLQ